MTVAKDFCKDIFKYEILETIYSDNGTHFVNQIVTKLNHIKRWVEEEEHMSIHSEDFNISHVYLTNSWYRYATMMAQNGNNGNCYVCIYIPVSSSHPILTVVPMDVNQSSCSIEFAGRAYNTGRNVKR